MQYRVEIRETSSSRPRCVVGLGYAQAIDAMEAIHDRIYPKPKLTVINMDTGVEVARK